MLFGVIVNASAQSFAAGHQAYVNRDYAQARSIWSALAAKKDARAQFGMGTLFHEGAAVDASPVQATRWFRLSAEQGYAPAQFNLGNAYQRGDGVEQSDELASQWWKKAADQEFAAAQYNLATQYFFGRGTAKDEGIARIYYRRAAENGHRKAASVLRYLETLNASNEGVISDSGEAGETTNPPTRSHEFSYRAAPPTTSVAALPSTPIATTPGSTQAPVTGLDSMTTGSGTSVGPRWVHEQNSAWFTVQLVAVGSEKRARTFIAKRSRSHPIGYVSVLREGKRLYSVLYGAFRDRQEAQQAARALPESALGGARPWIRKLAAVQAGQP